MHVLVHVHHHFSLPFFFAPVDERGKKNPGEREEKKNYVIRRLCYFFAVFFLLLLLRPFISIRSLFSPLSLPLSTLFVSKGTSVYKYSFFYYNTFNSKQYSYGLTSYQLFF
jgi:hypothetical protein